jgi:hypothetical protein
MEDLVFKNQFSSVRHLKDSNTLFIKWCDNETPMSLEEYKIPFLKTLEYQLTLNQKADNFLSDIRDQQTVSPKYQKWLQKEILAKASEVNIKHIGIIMSANAFKRFYINKVIKYITGADIPVKTFNSFDESIKWFKSFQKVS